jgi:hypothetical protein
MTKRSALLAPRILPVIREYVDARIDEELTPLVERIKKQADRIAEMTEAKKSNHETPPA